MTVEAGGVFPPAIENNCCLKGPISRLNNRNALGNDCRATALSLAMLLESGVFAVQTLDWADASKDMPEAKKRVSKSVQVLRFMWDSFAAFRLIRDVRLRCRSQDGLHLPARARPSWPNPFEDSTGDAAATDLLRS
jgi:hypothetical protein